MGKTIVEKILIDHCGKKNIKASVMTAAMIDRLTHKSYILNMNGSSYRLKETKEWLAK